MGKKVDSAPRCLAHELLAQTYTVSIKYNDKEVSVCRYERLATAEAQMLPPPVDRIFQKLTLTLTSRFLAALEFKNAKSTAA